MRSAFRDRLCRSMTLGRSAVPRQDNVSRLTEPLEGSAAGDVGSRTRQRRPSARQDGRPSFSAIVLRSKETKHVGSTWSCYVLENILKSPLRTCHGGATRVRQHAEHCVDVSGGRANRGGSLAPAASQVLAVPPAHTARVGRANPHRTGLPPRSDRADGLGVGARTNGPAPDNARCSRCRSRLRNRRAVLSGQRRRPGGQAGPSSKRVGQDAWASVIARPIRAPTSCSRRRLSTRPMVLPSCPFTR